MSKIEELAEKYAQEAYTNPVDRNIGKADFIVGANAVLEEIEGVLPYLAKNGVIYSILKDKIKELKGE